MKITKIFAIITMAAMLMSIGMLYVSAWPGAYTIGTEEDFFPVGTVKIDWDPDASKKLDLTDGDMSDWADAGYNVSTIQPENLISWVGHGDKENTNGVGDLDPDMPEGWHIMTYYVMDSDYLYVGFYVIDPNFAYGNAADYSGWGSAYQGDAFQISIDLGGKLGDLLREDPDYFENELDTMALFYSFSCDGDGEPLRIDVQNSKMDGILTEANGDGVKGAARKTTTGWSAEFALSLQMLIEHFEWKTYEQNTRIYVGGPEKLPLELDVALYYLDRSTTGGPITWAAGTCNKILDENGRPTVSWTPADSGINLVLEYEEGMTFNTPAIVVLDENGEAPTEAPTEVPTEPVTIPETEPETVATTMPADDTSTEAGGNSAETNATSDDTTEPAKGCASAVTSAAAGILISMGAAVIFAHKKEDR